MVMRSAHPSPWPSDTHHTETLAVYIGQEGTGRWAGTAFWTWSSLWPHDIALHVAGPSRSQLWFMGGKTCIGWWGCRCRSIGHGYPPRGADRHWGEKLMPKVPEMLHGLNSGANSIKGIFCSSAVMVPLSMRDCKIYLHPWTSPSADASLCASCQPHQCWCQGLSGSQAPWCRRLSSPLDWWGS